MTLTGSGARRVCAVLACVLLAMVSPRPAAASAGPAAASAGPAAALDWHACGGGRECATLEVPADYANPDGATLRLALARVAARDRRRRIGSLLVNPGGPGVSALESLPSLAAAFPDPVRDRFDIVSFDPRGVGASTPVDCAASLDPLFDSDFSPRDDAERASLVGQFRALADACAARNGPVLEQVSSLDTAHDMDRLRAALGDRELTFVGLSYGTYLGTLYAGLFPDRVRAMVLDGAVDPTIDATESTLLQARGFEQDLAVFLNSCSRQRGCAFHRDGKSAAAYDALRARIVARPLEVRGGRGLNDTRFDAAVVEALYRGREGWSSLARALADAESGDGSALLGLADRFVGRRADGSDDGAVESFWAVGCLDGPSPGGINEMALLERTAVRAAPRLGAFVANFSLACAVWPVAPIAGVPDLVGAAPDALVVGTTHDPATPLVSSRRLARLLGGAPLLVVDGERHTSFAAGNPCVDEAVARYLVEQESPPRGARC